MPAGVLNAAPTSGKTSIARGKNPLRQVVGDARGGNAIRVLAPPLARSGFISQDLPGSASGAKQYLRDILSTSLHGPGHAERSANRSCPQARPATSLYSILSGTRS